VAAGVGIGATITGHLPDLARAINTVSHAL
jgi:hypothetical protein